MTNASKASVWDVTFLPGVGCTPSPAQPVSRPASLFDWPASGRTPVVPAHRPSDPAGDQPAAANGARMPCITTGTATTIRPSAATPGPIPWASSMGRACMPMPGVIRRGSWIRTGRFVWTWPAIRIFVGGVIWPAVRPHVVPILAGLLGATNLGLPPNDDKRKQCTPVEGKTTTAGNDEECERQLDADQLYCGFFAKGQKYRFCLSQAMVRYAACLAGRPIPPLPY